MSSMPRVVVFDCEGPISKNDNAYELCTHFVPHGDKVFSNLSKYDDVVVDVLHREGYTAGSTLKLILPFLKAYDVTDKQMADFSAQNILLLPETHDTFSFIQQYAEVFIVSTSYEHYIQTLCKTIDFSPNHTYCTKVKLDNYSITDEEKNHLKWLVAEIANMRQIEIPHDAKAVADFSATDQIVIQRLDEIFTQELPRMSIGKLLTEVTTVGGEQKAKAIRDIKNRLGIKLSEIMYIGDSITDVEAFRLLHQHNGLAVSFNGNSYAVRNADVVVMAEGNLVLAVLADHFCRLGKDQTLNVISHWAKSVVEQSGVDSDLLTKLYAAYPGALPRVELMSLINADVLISESAKFRRNVRGMVIGRLG